MAAGNALASRRSLKGTRRAVDLRIVEMQPLDPRVLPAPPAPLSPTMPGSPEPGPVAFGAPAPPRPASKAWHVVRFALALVAWVGVFWGVSFIVANALMDDFYGSQAALDAAQVKGGAVVLVTWAAWVLATMGLIAPSVGYRRRDAFFMLVPLYNYAFGVKMLWRWTALPDRYWDRAGGGVVDSFVAADAGRRRAWRPADPFIAIMCVVAVGLVVAMTNREMLTTSDETVTARGLTIVVPPGYYVTTDPTDAARIMSESGGVFDERFQDLFVMLAIEPTRAGESSITIFRVPSPAATLFATARDLEWYLEQSGVFVSKETTVVGTGPYPAARIEWRSGPSGMPPGPATSFVIDDGERIWMLVFAMPAGEDASLAQLVDRTMETLELP